MKLIKKPLDYLNWKLSKTGMTITHCEPQATGHLVIPPTIDGEPVTKIEGWAFYGCTGLSSVTVPSCVKTIGHNAFDSRTSVLAQKSL